MEPPAAPPRRACIPWRGLLLTASLLTWNAPASVGLTINSVPPNVAEGQQVLLKVIDLPKDILGFRWHKGNGVLQGNLIGSYTVNTKTLSTGPQHSGRETLYPNGSMLIERVTRSDQIIFTLQTLSSNMESSEETAQFSVYPDLPKPSITSSNNKPVENRDSVTLTCNPDTQDTRYEWWIKDKKVARDKRKSLTQRNRILTIKPIMRNDVGPYACKNINEATSKTSKAVTLNVLYGPDTPIITPSASYFSKGVDFQLLCQAASHPAAQYTWFINGISTESTQATILINNATKSNSGTYTCRAHNFATGIVSTKDKKITVLEKRFQFSPRAGVVILIEVLAGLAVLTAVMYVLYFRKTDSQEAKVQGNVAKETPKKQQEKKDEVAYSSLNFNAQPPKQPTTASPSSTATETVYSEVKK